MVEALAPPLFDGKGAPTEVNLNGSFFERGIYYSNPTKKEEKVHSCYSGRRAFPLLRRRGYRMISPFLFSRKVCQRTIRCPLSRYAGRREDGACFRP
jgi:hypothetical protein